MSATGSFFSGFSEIRNFRANGVSANFRAIAKIASYFTIVVPLCVGLAYGVKRIFTYCSGQKNPEQQKASDIFSKKDWKIQEAVDGWSDAKVPEGYKLPCKTVESLDHLLANIQYFHENCTEENKARLFFGVYQADVRPKKNWNNLLTYIGSESYKKDCGTVQVYFNKSQLCMEDAQRVVLQREPVNISQSQWYNRSLLKLLFGYECSVYNDPSAKKKNQTDFKELPNTVAIYSETRLWKKPGEEGKSIPVAILSLPAPALDDISQPNYSYYVQDNKLDQAKYQAEIDFLFTTVEKAVEDNAKNAFSRKGIKRVVLSKFGQANFLTALSPDDQTVAHTAYKDRMNLFLKWMEENYRETPVVMSVYSDKSWIEDKEINGIKTRGTIRGDILETAEERDLIINAWDPHSVPGNGNDGDPSFDGAIGKGTGAHVTQSLVNLKLIEGEKFFGIMPKATGKGGPSGLICDL